MRENTDQEKTLYLDTFYSVSIIGGSLEIKELNGQKYLLDKAKVLYRNEKDSCGWVVFKKSCIPMVNSNVLK